MNMDGVVTMNQRASFQNSSQSISVWSGALRKKLLFENNDTKKYDSS